MLSASRARKWLRVRSGMGEVSCVIRLTFRIPDQSCLRSIGLLVIGVAAGTGAGRRQSPPNVFGSTRGSSSSDLLEGRGTGHARRRHWRPSISPRNWRWPGRSRRATTAPTFSKVPLVGIETQPGATLSAAVRGKSLDFRWGDDFVGTSQTQRPDTRFRRRRRVRGARDHGAGVPVGRFQRRRRDGQGGGAVHQRAAVRRSEILRRARADLLRPLGLQIRRGAAPRGASVHHHPHDADGQLRVGRGAQLVGQGGSVRETGAGGRRRCRSRAG